MFRSALIAGFLTLTASWAGAATISHNCTVTPDLQSSIGPAGTGDTINVTGGTCSRPGGSGFVIQKTLTLRCTGACTLTGGDAATGFATVLVNNGAAAANTTIDNFTVNGAIVIDGTNSPIIRNNVVTGTSPSASCGIQLHNIQNGVVLGNAVNAFNYGLCLLNDAPLTGGNILMNNNVTQTSAFPGIGVTLSDNNHIVGNVLRNTVGTAITVLGSRNNVLERNDLGSFPTSATGGDGILLSTSGSRTSSNNIICKNTIVASGFVGGVTQRNAGTGIFLNQESDGTCVTGNRISNNTEGGLTSFGSSYNYWARNEIFQNGQVGVFLWDKYDFPAAMAGIGLPGTRTRRNYIHNNYIHDIPINGLVQGRGTGETEVAYNYLHATAYNVPPNTTIQGVRFETYSPDRNTTTDSPKVFGNTMLNLFGAAFFGPVNGGPVTNARYFRNRAFNAPRTQITGGSTVTLDNQAFIGGNYWSNQSPAAGANPDPTRPYTNFLVGYRDRWPFKDPTFGDTYSIAVTNPRLGASLAAGSTKTIQWQSTACVTVDIALLQGGVPQSTIVANYPNHGSYIWDVPSVTPASNYAVRVTCKDAANASTGQVSDSPLFRIGSANLVLMSPGCGEPLTGGSTVRVAWKKIAVATVNVEYWRDDAFVSTLVTGVTGDFTDVTIPATQSSHVTLRIVGNVAGTEDSSDDQIAVRTGTTGSFVNVPVNSIYVPGRVYDLEWTQPSGTFYQDLEMFDGTAQAYVPVALDLPSCTRKYRMMMEELWMLQGRFRVTYKDQSHNPIGTAATSSNMSVRFETTAGTPVNLLRLNNVATGEHLLTTDQHEYDVLSTPPSPWLGEGRVGGLMNGPATLAGFETVPFYRMFRTDNGFHFWTSDRNEYFTLRNGNVFFAEKHMGYLYPPPPITAPTTPCSAVTPGTTEMRRLSNKTNGTHLYSTSLNEYTVLVASGQWNGEGVLGCILN
jgi:parallel beta-helix repeat protein